LESELAGFAKKRLAKVILRQSERNCGIGAQIFETVQGLLIASGSNDSSGPKKLRTLHCQFAGDTRRAKDEHIFTWQHLCPVRQ
jgi:hypothetical protein